MANPSQEHMTAAKRVLRYLRGTLDHGLTFVGGQGIRLEGFCDSDFAGDVVERKSTSGYVFRFCGGTISWSSKRQSVVAKSSTEAEYIAMSRAASEAVWLRYLLKDLGFEQTGGTTMFVDNVSAVALAKNPKFHDRTKHIDVQFHYIRECVANDCIKLVYCPSRDNVADVLTKSLAKPAFRVFCGEMGVEAL